MKYLLFLLTVVVLNPSFAQTEKATYKTVADNFEQYYNDGNPELIFKQFSTKMQAALPLDKTTDFINQLKAGVGKIAGRTFVGYQNNVYATYKTRFERATMALNIAVDADGKINGLFVKAYTESNLPKMERNVTPLILPFAGEWTVNWGGDTKELNYHVESEAQKNAFDMVITDDKGRSYRTDGKTNEDYYAFGKQLFAPCNGEVVLVVDGVNDNMPGNVNPIYVPGNTVIIKTAKNEYLFFAHFKQHSIVVKQGQQVKQGQALGLCGNSGNSTEPHLHFHLQNVEDMNIATGVKCYFERINVNGQPKDDYSPIQKDKISNL